MAFDPKLPVVMLLAVALGCGSVDEPPDPHSCARPGQVAVEHLKLDLRVDFESKRVEGRASLRIRNAAGVERLWLDTRDLDVRRVGLGDDDVATEFRIGEPRPFIGSPLEVRIRPDTTWVHVDYASRPEAAALLWLAPEQTAGGRNPFLLSQSQAILARTWIPCQDTPTVRTTYEATVRVPPGLMALMSAENPTTVARDGVYRFRMRQPIPAYLMALAVGEVEFRALGPRSGVYAEPPLVDAAAWEFAETEQMMHAAERLYGPYRWGRYDLLVLPAGFPFGGMENPRLSFITPTLIAGDRSLVTTIAHELAHSWSGNLVTNATWNEFWLNEGFTVYFERRIMEALHGRDFTEMIGLLSMQDLQEELERLGPESPDSRLHLDLAGRDPDDGSTDVPYDKGYLLLRLLEETFGRDAWDAFLRDYFERFAFTSMTSRGFVNHLRARLVETAADPAALERSLQLDAWIWEPGLPSNAPTIASPAFERVDRQIAAWVSGRPASGLDTVGWTTHQRLHFIRNLPDSVTAERMAELDGVFDFTRARNAEILCAWLVESVERGYTETDGVLERFLTGMGRAKFLEPLYRSLVRRPGGLERAREIYSVARPGYHPLAQASVDEILGWPAPEAPPIFP